MEKKISELNKEEQLLLLKGVANGEIDKSSLNNDTLVWVSEHFLELIKRYSSHRDDIIKPKYPETICIGDGAKWFLDLMDRSYKAKMNDISENSELPT